jgi:hypothetical protein
MSNREQVLDIVKKLPDDTPIEEIIRQIAFVTGMNEALEQSEREGRFHRGSPRPA